MKRTLYTDNDTDFNPATTSNDFLNHMKQLVQKLSSWLPSSFDTLAGMQDAAVVRAPDKAYLAYTQSVTALAAKLACVDGAPVKAEFDAFSALFAFEKVDAHLLKRIFIKHAQETGDNIDQYARSLAGMALSAMQREELLRRLTLLGACDGRLSPVEIQCLKDIADTLGLTTARWRETLAPHLGLTRGTDPYTVLGVNRRTSLTDIRARYVDMLRVAHPDQLASLKLSDATRELLHDYARVLVSAYESLAKQRKL